MNQSQSAAHASKLVSSKTAKSGPLSARLAKHKYIYLLLAPGVLYFLIFKYGPMWGLVLAFQNYNPFGGVWKSEFVGLAHFSELLKSDYFLIMLRNTFFINLFGLVFYFPLPVVLAVLLNEVRVELFKRISQSVIYLPHFLSWVVVASVTYFVLSYEVGFINKLYQTLGWARIPFLSKTDYFWGILTAQTIWKEAGWGTIIFLAAVSGVDPQRYEAAVIDGASRFRQVWHITLPAIRPTILILLILRLGSMADVGFEQVVLMMNPQVISVAEVFDTYSFNQGILLGQYSVGVTVGIFKGIIGLIFVLVSNYIVKKLGHEGIY
ncbi:ABC transporter permease [Paenibacillus thalictri]|uniref:Sugar ABC transporter permease n=1 Tax=Paenibacillus thalictri TaxID=2527873 RepID=A0A4Q9DRV1_9BACL|nr:ABC transporter permease subunit [Paenibacillus thalictri]TBL79519.1 sugar ABC transporter permease [Paenibacillus thalictri]